MILSFLSGTKDRLQNAIDIVSKYCEDWSLSINARKSKIMICNKRLATNDRFLVKNDVLETVKKYNYLGIIILNTSCFGHAIEA